MLGFEGDGNRGVRKMMKRFPSLRTISRLTDILIKHYKEHFINRGRVSIHPLDDNFELVNQSLCLRKDDLFLRYPDRILDLFSTLHSMNKPKFFPQHYANFRLRWKV